MNKLGVEECRPSVQWGCSDCGSYGLIRRIDPLAKEKMPISIVLVFIASAIVRGESAQKPRADLNVTEMISQDVQGDTYRAIKGYDEIYPFLVLERIRPPAIEGDQPHLVYSWTIREMLGGQSFAHAREGDEITEIRWRGEVLEFLHTVEKGKRSCRISRITEMKPSVSCQPVRR